MRVNLKDVEEGGYTLYPSSAYTVRIKSIEEVVAASSGNNQLRIKSVIIGGDYDSKKITDHITLIDTVAWKLKSFIASMGLDPNIEVDTDSGAFRNMLNKFINKTAVWVVDQETDNKGKLRNVINAYEVDPNATEPADDAPEFLQTAKENVPWDEEKTQ